MDDRTGKESIVEGKKRKPGSVREDSISPPPIKRHLVNAVQQTDTASAATLISTSEHVSHASPFRLNTIRDLLETSNQDSLSLADIIGDPLISEIWFFDYLYDVDWLIGHFDSDVRHLVRIKIVHGSWRQDDPNKLSIDEAASRHQNVESITAYMPEAFGTHHSKMMVIFRHDEEAQIVIHTANMISRDWTNMSQAIWLSPRLPSWAPDEGSSVSAIGSGSRFKHDLLRYLSAYGQKRTGPLTEQLKHYDFSSVRAALVASVPCRLLLEKDTRPEVLFGWPYLRHVLRQVPEYIKASRPLIVAQVSSIAYMGEDWIDREYLKTARGISSITSVLTAIRPDFLETLGTTNPSTASSLKPSYKIMFPTVEEIRSCLDGYKAGASIHMRIQSNQARRQLAYLRPYFVRWTSTDPHTNSNEQSQRNPCRGRAAPHVKTYVRYSDNQAQEIDWALLTSANLSTQAWGSMPKDGQVRISSYEIGVVVWPSMLTDGVPGAMVPTSKQDLPDSESYTQQTGKSIVGLRIPYGFPLRSYGKTDDPWIATAAYEHPDIHGWIQKAARCSR